MSAPCGLGRSALALALAAIGLTACAAPEKATSPPAGAQAQTRLRQVEPPAGIGAVERYAWLTVVQLGEYYATGDVDGFLGRVSRGFYRGYPALEAALRALVAATVERTAVVAVREVALEGDRVAVRAQWERSLTRQGGERQELAGETTFLFLRSDTSLRLLDFRGDVPFGIEGLPAAP